MKHNYISSKQLSVWIRLTKKWNNLFSKIVNSKSGLSENLKKFNSLSSFLGIKKKIAFSTLAGMATLGVQAQDFIKQDVPKLTLNQIPVNSSSRPILIDIDNDNDLDLVLKGISGLTYFENDGNDLYLEKFDNDNPFSDIATSYGSGIDIKDLDGDGNLNLIHAPSNGLIEFYNSDEDNNFTLQTGADSIPSEYGSTPIMEDVDSDGDLDLLIGDYYGNIAYYSNDGSSFTKQTDASNPFDSISTSYYSTQTMADVDGDGDLDLVIGDYYAKLLYFKNLGNNEFSEQTGVNNPFEGLNLSYTTKPYFTDIDNDGDLDLLVSNGIRISTFINKGNQVYEEQVYEEVNIPLESIDMGASTIPELADLDNDGDMDMILTSENRNKIAFYQNQGDNTFTRKFDSENPFDNVDLNQNPKYKLIDLDNDNDLDLVIASFNSGISYYENTGSNVFISRTGANNPFDDIQIRSSAHDLVDFDNDGDLDLIIGGFDDGLFYYENDGNQVFTEQVGTDNPFDFFHSPSWSAPDLIDLDADGDLDLFVTNNRGVSFYENDGVNTFTFNNIDNPLSEVGTGRVFNIVTFPSPDFIDFDNDGDLDVVAGDTYGTLTYYENQEIVSAIFDKENSQEAIIYPNPASTIVNLASGFVTIYNQIGTLVLSKETEGQLDISALEQGIYILTINDKKTKLIIE